MSDFVSPHDTALDHLAALVIDTYDYTLWCSILKPLLAPTTFEQLCYMLEACPEHCCDQQICRDDQDDTCQIGREAQ